MLHEHLTRGYSLNEHRLARQGLAELEQAVELLGQTLTRQELVSVAGASRPHLRVLSLPVVQGSGSMWYLYKGAPVAKASTNEEPDAGKLHVRDSAGDAG